MTNLIVKLFIKDPESVKSPAVRTRYGIVASIVGIICNVFLAALKLFLGTLANSIAITADAVNNLSDTASNVVTLVSFKISAKPADSKHPFGHGRIEYLCALVISFFILLVGFELGKASVLRIIGGERSQFSVFVVIGLVVSILTKLWMGRFNRKLGKKINSSAMLAVSKDSVSDALSTAVTLIAVCLSPFTQLPVDGYVGILVSLFVFMSGVGIIRDTLTPLLGTVPDADIVEKIYKTVIAHDGIYGIHDLIVHEYGPGKLFASLHAEVSASEDVMVSHALIDLIEREVAEQLDVELVIHMDPLETECSETKALHDAVYDAVRKLDGSFSIHDFRTVPSGEYKNVLFDVVVPMDYKASDKEVAAMVEAAVSALDPSFIVKPLIDRSYL